MRKISHPRLGFYSIISTIVIGIFFLFRDLLLIRNLSELTEYPLIVLFTSGALFSFIRSILDLKKKVKPRWKPIVTFIISIAIIIYFLA